MKNWEESVLLSDGLMKLRGSKPQTERFIGQKSSTASSVFPENFEAVKSNFMMTRASSQKVSQLGEVIDEPTTSRRERLEIYDQDLQILCQSKVRTKVSLSTGDKKLTAMVENFDSRKGYGFRTSKALESPEIYFQVLLLNMEQSRKDSRLGYRNGVVNVANCENLIQENKLYMFAGKNPSHWILRAETFSSSFRDEDKLVIVGAYLERAASKWFSWEMHKKRITNWSDFKNKLLARFDAPVQVCAPQEVILQHDSIPAINHKSGLSCEIAAIDGVVKTDSFLIHESVNSMNLENDSVQKRYLPSPLQNTVEIQHQPSRQNINLTEEIVSHIIPETEETEVWQNNVNIAEIMLRNDSFLEADQEVEDIVNLDDEFSSKVIVHEAAGAQVADPPVMDETVNVWSSLIHTDCFRDLVSSIEGSSTKSVGIKVTAVKEKAEIPQPKSEISKPETIEGFINSVDWTYLKCSTLESVQGVDIQCTIVPTDTWELNDSSLSHVLENTADSHLATVSVIQPRNAENLSVNVTGADLKQQQGRTQFLLLIFKEFGRVQRPWLRSALETQSNSFQLWHRWKNKMGISLLIFINEKCELFTEMPGHDMLSENILIFHGSQFSYLFGFSWVQRLLRETLKQLRNLWRKHGIQTVQQCTLINGEFHVKHKWKSKSEKLLTAKEIPEEILSVGRDMLLLQLISSFHHILGLFPVSGQWFYFGLQPYGSDQRCSQLILHSSSLISRVGKLVLLQTHRSYYESSTLILFRLSLRTSLFSRVGVCKGRLTSCLIMVVLIWLSSTASEFDLLKKDDRKQWEKEELITHWLHQVLIQQRQRWKKSYKTRIFKYKERTRQVQLLLLHVVCDLWSISCLIWHRWRRKDYHTCYSAIADVLERLDRGDTSALNQCIYLCGFVWCSHKSVNTSSRAQHVILTKLEGKLVFLGGSIDRPRLSGLLTWIRELREIETLDGLEALQLEESGSARPGKQSIKEER